MQIPPIPVLAATLLVIFLAIGIHEYCHAKFADMAGDPTPRYFGRVTLNLFNHFDPLGTIMIILTTLTGFGIGWGRPVPMDPSKMRNPRWDHFIAVLAGPFSNLFQAAVYAGVLRVALTANPAMLQGDFFSALVVRGVQINLALCFFNLLPLGPLDGMWIFGSFLDEKSRTKWTNWNRQFGWTILIAVILVGQLMPGPGILWLLIGPPIKALFHLLTGVPYSAL
ncbi:MAG: site-2 protease family protein [Armatimonadetes bacterium]|nr:site-2 protease family protein [Armatimonadota bacterium]